MTISPYGVAGMIAGAAVGVWGGQWAAIRYRAHRDFVRWARERARRNSEEWAEMQREVERGRARRQAL